MIQFYVVATELISSAEIGHQLFRNYICIPKAYSVAMQLQIEMLFSTLTAAYNANWRYIQPVNKKPPQPINLDNAYTVWH